MDNLIVRFEVRLFVASSVQQHSAKHLSIFFGVKSLKYHVNFSLLGSQDLSIKINIVIFIENNTFFMLNLKLDLYKRHIHSIA